MGRNRYLGSLLTAAYAVSLACSIAHAQTLSFEIPEGDLKTALDDYARQSGLQLIYRVEDVRGVSTRGIRGTLPAETALERILAGTGFTVTRDSDGAIAIVGQANQAKGIPALQASPAVNEEPSSGITPMHPVNGPSDVQQMDAVVVTGTTINDPILSSRLGDTLRDRPQSVSMVTRERLDEQNLNSLDAALGQTTGITLTKESANATQFFSRGFEIRNVQVDGGSPLAINAGGYDQRVDLAFYEQIEVLRGGDALFSGNGDPGGTIQLVRKRPTDTPQLNVDASVGRWSNYRGGLDASGPIAADGKLRGRAVYMRENAGSFQDNIIKTNRDALYLVVEADATETTKVFLGGSYSRSLSPIGGFGLPRFADGTDLGLPRSQSLTTDWSKSDTTTSELFGTVDQRLGGSWNLRVNAMRSDKSSDFNFYYSFAAIDPVTRTGMLYGTSAEREAVQKVMDVTLTGSFDLWGRTHKVAIGADWQQSETNGPSWNTPSYMIDPFAFDASAYPFPSRSATPDSTVIFGSKQDGAYLSLNLHATEALRILAGARYSNYQYKSDYPAFGSYLLYEDRDVVTPYVGFTYALPRGWVGYGSYAENFSSQASMLSGPFPPGKPLDPITGETFEVGVKGDLGRRAAAQVAVYQSERTGEAVVDPAYPQQAGNLGATCCYLAQGVVVSRGLDAEINGRITARWAMFVGYTLNDNELKSGYTANLGTAYMPRTPRHLFKLWTTYQFSGHLEQLKVSAGINAQSGNFRQGFVNSVPYEFSQGGYTIVGARAEYLFNEVWSAALNLDNLLDKTYYQTVGNTFAGNWYGQPRSYTLSVRGKW